MSNIDEIMGAIGCHGDDCIRDADAASESFEALRELIAAALADAERKGAEAMREQCADRWDGHDIDVLGHCTNVGASIRALPLPTGERQAVLLTDDAADAHAKSVMDAAEVARRSYRIGSAGCGTRSAVRAIESDVLAKNNLGVGCG